MTRMLLLVAVLGWVVAPAASRAQAEDVRTLVRQAYALLDESKLTDARTAFEAVLVRARERGDRQAEADALRGVGTVLYQQARWGDAPAVLEQARTIYAALPDPEGEARTLDLLGSTAAMRRDSAAQTHYDRALALFTQAGNAVEQARVLRNMTHLASLPLSDRQAMLERALPLAEGDARVHGLVLHSLGSMLMTQGRYAAAVAHLEQARPLLAKAGSPREQARLISSLAQSYNLHGRSDRSVELYDQVVPMFERVGDLAGLSQTLVLAAEAHLDIGQRERAVALHERGVLVAEKTGSPGLLSTALAALGNAYVAVGQFDKAIGVMEESLGNDAFPDVSTGFYRTLARAYAGAGRFDDALKLATRGVDAAREKGRLQVEMGSLHVRALIHEQRGALDLALADARAGLDALERLRHNLAPSDYLKSGFANDLQSLFRLTISLLDRTGRTGDAVVVAEQARARAFLDLLATRDAAETVTPPPPATTVASAAATASLTLRGMAPATATAPVVPSTASAPVPTEATVRDVARRLGSTLLTYWVGPEATYVWVVSPDGRVASHRAAIPVARLTALVQQTWALDGGAVAQRGGAAALDYVTTRGGSRIAPLDVDLTAHRQLYDLLIQPVRAALPRTPNSLLTVVPHGPLFELSFAALRDPRGRFLLEDYRLHYAPSAASLDFTVPRPRPAAAAEYLFIANPAVAAATAPTPLAPLPGAEREVRAVARLVGARGVTTLSQSAAHEAAVRNAIGRYRVVHFATHGLVSSDRPFESFLALAATGTGAAVDGRLTAAEIYDLRLSADLVVLSACRAAGGRISGDGIVGLTRAFFTAGSPTILAALWDVADESAEHLLPRFYAEWQRRADKSAALRAAQLSMLQDLRAGRVTVQTPLGDLPLPAHPALWANLVLLGEPH